MGALLYKHPTLLYENYKTFNIVKKGKSDKTCEHCKAVIPIGMVHKVHMFCDYESYPSHLECSIPFAASLV